MTTSTAAAVLHEPGGEFSLESVELDDLHDDEILVGINYIDRVFSGALTRLDYLKIVLTCFVPYGVSTYASVESILKEKQGP